MMKKIFLLACLLLSIGQASQAQNEATDFKKLLAYFKEIEAGSKIDEVAVLRSIKTDIDKSLAWQFLMEKNSLMKPEEVFAHPIAYFKKTENIVVLLFSTGEKGNAMFYGIGMQSYDVKKGKLIGGISMVGSFNDKGNAYASIDISSDKKTIDFGSKSVAGNTLVKVEISNSGKLKVKE
jgi:hypothetical protein